MVDAESSSLASWGFLSSPEGASSCLTQVSTDCIYYSLPMWYQHIFDAKLLSSQINCKGQVITHGVCCSVPKRERKIPGNRKQQLLISKRTISDPCLKKLSKEMTNSGVRKKRWRVSEFFKWIKGDRYPDRGVQTFPVKGQIVNSWDCADHARVSVTQPFLLL